MADRSRTEGLPPGPARPRLASPAEWSAAAEDLGRGEATLLGLWGSGTGVHMALLADGGIDLLDLETRDRFPSVARHHAPAIRPERAIADLHGLRGVGAPDSRPWLDHGKWPVTHPLGKAFAAGEETAAYAFLSSEGESLYQVPVGPVHAGIIEPGHFRFTVQGETVVRLEERLGYTHKGVQSLMRGADLKRGAELAGRVSGDSTVAYAWAFARAVESALEVEVPARALMLRAIMAETERLANHLGDFGAICNDAAFAMMLAQCGVLRERVLRAAAQCFGHRLMRDGIVPGGVSVDPDSSGLAVLGTAVTEIGRRIPRLIGLYDNTASLLDRTVGTGRLDPGLARWFGAGGFVGRASGRDFDVRRDLPYPPYDTLPFVVPVREDGDVNARIWIRIDEIGQSLALIERCLADLPAGPVLADLPRPGEPRQGLAMIEGFRGDILAWVALTPEACIEDSFLRDPSWFQWPLLEAAIEGNILADFPLCNKSFNCSYSGQDL
jgi:Ni,Fe-hydrogenase III large subunit